MKTVGVFFFLVLLTTGSFAHCQDAQLEAAVAELMKEVQ